MMEEAIIHRLLNDAALVSLVANRVFPGEREQGSALPAVVIHLVDGNPIYTDDGDTGLQNDLLQIDCWASTYKTAKQVQRAVENSLSAFHGIEDGVEFETVLINDRRDFPELGRNLPGYPRRSSVDFNIWYRND